MSNHDWKEAGLASKVLCPGGEGLPRGSLAERKTNLLHKNQKRTGPNGGAMNLVYAPQIVNHEKKQKDVGQQTGNKSIVKADGYRQSRNRGDQQRSGSNIDQSFVCRRITSGAKRSDEEDSEDQHLRQLNDIKSFGIPAHSTGVPRQRSSDDKQCPIGIANGNRSLAFDLRLDRFILFSFLTMILRGPVSCATARRAKSSGFMMGSGATRLPSLNGQNEPLQAAAAPEMDQIGQMRLKSDTLLPRRCRMKQVLP
jgi:hypothetical protein